MLTIQNLSKKYVTEYALSDFSLTVEAGKIHGIIGANGSGKSTLLKILNGDESIEKTGGYEGTLILNGQVAVIRNHYDAMRHGIAMVHQELAVLNELSVASNIKLNRENLIPSPLPKGFQQVDERRNQKEATETLQKISADIDPKRFVENLTTNQKQFVEIARELDNDQLKLLMLDEPTSALNVKETENLMLRLRELANRGIAILFVSHRLEEVYTLCDTVSVLRDGKRIATYDRPEFSIERFTLDMIGDNVVKAQREVRDRTGKPILSFCFSESEKDGKTADLEVFQGEILGITGLAGNGKERYSKSLMGLVPMNGQIYYNGKILQPGEEKNIYRDNIYYLSDDRAQVSLLRKSPIWKNIIFGTEKKHPEFLKFPRWNGLSPMNMEIIGDHCSRMIRELHISAVDAQQPAGNLSGGNQQKVCIARALTMESTVLFVDEPTRGIDVFSKEVILNLLLKMNREKGTTIVITSGEVDELVRVCDRVAVLYENRVFAIMEGEMNLGELTFAMFGRTSHAV